LLWFENITRLYFYTLPGLSFGILIPAVGGAGKKLDEADMVAAVWGVWYFFSHAHLHWIYFAFWGLPLAAIFC